MALLCAWPTHDLVVANFLSSVCSSLTSEACEKSSQWLWKESCVITGVRKHICITDRHDMTLAVTVAFNLNTTIFLQGKAHKYVLDLTTVHINPLPDKKFRPVQIETNCRHIKVTFKIENKYHIGQKTL